MANLELDIDYNGVATEVVSPSKGAKEDYYPRVVRYAKSKGISQSEVDNLMLEIAGNYSSMTDEEIAKEIQSDIDKKCERIYEKDGAEAFNKCRQTMIEEYKKKELRKSKAKGFFSKLVTNINKLGQMREGYGATSSGQNIGESKDNTNDSIDDSTDVKILGMKPLVFTLVALGTVTALGVSIVLLTRKGKK